MGMSVWSMNSYLHYISISCWRSHPMLTVTDRKFVEVDLFVLTDDPKEC
jgi:hypothetical protein